MARRRGGCQRGLTRRRTVERPGWLAGSLGRLLSTTARWARLAASSQRRRLGARESPPTSGPGRDDAQSIRDSSSRAIFNIIVARVSRWGGSGARETERRALEYFTL